MSTSQAQVRRQLAMQAFGTWVSHALDALASIATWIVEVMKGPFGGVIGGALSFLLLEIRYRTLRERHAVAETVAAELSHIVEQVDAFITGADVDQIPAYYRTSHVLFDALAGRLAVLDFEDVVSISRLYHLLDELNRMPKAWFERASNAYALPINHPAKAFELKAVKDGSRMFYEKLGAIRGDCVGLATDLRTKYPLGWRALIPLRFRPTRALPQRKAANVAA